MDFVYPCTVSLLPVVYQSVKQSRNGEIEDVNTTQVMSAPDENEYPCEAIDENGSTVFLNFDNIIANSGAYGFYNARKNDKVNHPARFTEYANRVTQVKNGKFEEHSPEELFEDNISSDAKNIGIQKISGELAVYSLQMYLNRDTDETPTNQSSL